MISQERKTDWIITKAKVGSKYRKTKRTIKRARKKYGTRTPRSRTFRKWYF